MAGAGLAGLALWNEFVSGVLLAAGCNIQDAAAELEEEGTPDEPPEDDERDGEQWLERIIEINRVTKVRFRMHLPQRSLTSTAAHVLQLGRPARLLPARLLP